MPRLSGRLAPVAAVVVFLAATPPVPAEEPPELVVATKDNSLVIRYSPKALSTELKAGERPAAYFLISPIDGRVVDQDVASSGGEFRAYRDRENGLTVFFSKLVEKKSGRVIGFFFWIPGESFEELMPGGALTLSPRWSEYDPTLLGPLLKVSAAIGAVNKGKRRTLFVRFATGIAVTPFAAAGTRPQ